MAHGCVLQHDPVSLRSTNARQCSPTHLTATASKHRENSKAIHKREQHPIDFDATACGLPCSHKQNAHSHWNTVHVGEVEDALNASMGIFYAKSICFAPGSLPTPHFVLSVLWQALSAISRRVSTKTSPATLETGPGLLQLFWGHGPSTSCSTVGQPPSLPPTLLLPLRVLLTQR